MTAAPKKKSESKKGVPDIRNPRARRGSGLTDEDAKIIAPKLKELYERNPRTKLPQAFVEEARDPESPLHPFLPWDDTKAAHLYRLERARQIIGAITYDVVMVDDDGKIAPSPFQDPTGSLTIRAFPHLKGEGEQSNYMPIEIVLVDENLKGQLIEKARLEAEKWLERYQAVAELSAPVALVKKAVAMMKRKLR